MAEAEKYPMGYAYKKTEILDDDGNVSEKTIPFFPYSKTFAITNKDNINLDVLLEELKHWEGFPVTTDITWKTPGVYALDASVGGKYYELCQQVFQSADNALKELCRIVGLTYDDTTNFSTALAEFKTKINIIKNTIISLGGNCPENPTLTQINTGILSIPRLNIKTKSFRVMFSYNEIKNFNKEYSGNYYAVCVNIKDYINDCKTIIYVENYFDGYWGTSSQTAYDYICYYPVRIFFNDVQIAGMRNGYDAGHNYGGFVHAYTEKFDVRSGSTYTFSGYHNHYAFDYTKDNGIHCAAYYLIRTEGTNVIFGISTASGSYIDKVASSDWYGMGYTNAEKAQWKTEKHIGFNFRVTYIA